MAKLSRAVASLRVVGENLVPDDVSKLLDATPSRSYARGEVISGLGATRVAKFGFWSLDAPETEPADIDAQVARLLSSLSPDLEAWRQLAGAFKVDLFCGWFMERGNEGLEIASGTLLALAERQIALGLDIYCNTDSR